MRPTASAATQCSASEASSDSESDDLESESVTPTRSRTRSRCSGCTQWSQCTLAGQPEAADSGKIRLKASACRSPEHHDDASASAGVPLACGGGRECRRNVVARNHWQPHLHNIMQSQECDGSMTSATTAAISSQDQDLFRTRSDSSMRALPVAWLTGMPAQPASGCQCVQRVR